jgi:Carboxypeptidase regulatory-like domain
VRRAGLGCPAARFRWAGRSAGRFSFHVRPVGVAGGAAQVIESRCWDPVPVARSAATGGGLQTRVEYLEGVLPPLVGGSLRDIGPSAMGDATGTGIFFYGLPIAIVAMVTAIVLLQLAVWSMARKLRAVVVVGVFTSVVTYAIAVWQQVIPLTWSSALLMAGTFVFIQAVGWTLTGAATFVCQYFVPLALTFVLVLGVPTAGAPVSPDMLTTALGRLHEVMPLGQFVELVRSTAYGVGSPLHPWLVMSAWFVVGAVLSFLAHRHLRTVPADRPHSPGRSGAPHSPSGTVTSLSGAPLAHAAVRVLDPDGGAEPRSTTDAAGRYSIDGVPAGSHHLLVTGAHADP